MIIRYSKLFLFVVMLSFFPLPLIGAGALPPNFGVFPPVQNSVVETFSIPYFIFGSSVCVIILLPYFFPQFLGFKVNPTVTEAKPGRWPVWFWIGLATMIVFWIIMWRQFSVLGSLLNFTFVPLWWGLILTLDGFTYYRSNGVSLLATKPRTLFWVSMLSIWGWFLFEYFNYFVYSNWYYPIRDKFSTVGYVIWFSLAYTTVWPAIFEWYTVLCTFPSLKNRFAQGPKIQLPTAAFWGLLLLGGINLIALGRFPFLLFFTLWLGALFMLWGALELVQVKTPLSELAKGNWTPMLLIGLASFLTGISWEGWNFMSYPSNPNFWGYEIPYVDIGAYFGEMPLMGMFGYFPFGLLCWLLWLATTHILGLDKDFGLGLDKVEG